jgi:hypothetical protein
LVKDASGNVGIGVASPVGKLDIISGTARMFFSNQSATAFFTAVNTANSAYAPMAINGSELILKTGDAERARIDASGNVGIGTSSPLAKLNVNTTGANSRIAIGDTAVGTYSTLLMYGGSGKYNFQLGVQNNVNNAFEITPSTAAGGTTFSTPAMVVDSSGNLLVGKTDTNFNTAGAKLATSGNEFTASAGKAIAANRTTSDGAVIEMFRQGTSVGSISVTASATAYNTSSDYRLKNTIAPMTGALDKVALLKPCTYKWNVDGSDGQGFIAHELQEVVEGCVTGEKDAVDAEGNPVHQGIDTSFLVATLTAAIQELKGIVDAQAVRIAALEA